MKRTGIEMWKEEVKDKKSYNDKHVQNGTMEYFSEDIVEGDSLEEKFEFLYDSGCVKQGDPFHIYRKRINNFHKHLCRKQPGKHLNKYGLANKVVAWKMIAVLVKIDYRTLRAFALQSNRVTPHKATWDKLKPLLELLEKKENAYQRPENAYPTPTTGG